jgi:hypothetical protein
MDIPLAVVAAGEYLDAEGKLRRELGRLPTENEVRARLGRPLVVSRAEFPVEALTVLAGTEIPLPGTRYRLSVSRPFKTGAVKVTLLELPEP